MPSQSQIDEADNTAYASMRATHFPSTSMSLSSINMSSQNAHIALVRNLSSGRPVWWIDHGISSSRRAEVIMRRKMVYLQEEHDNNNARAASTNTPADVPIIDAVGCGGGVTQTTIERQNNMMDSSATESMSSSSSASIPLPQLHPSIDNSQYENGTERNHLSVASDQMEFMYDNNKNICRESSSETQPQSPNEVGCNDSNNFLHDAATIHQLNDDIPMVKLLLPHTTSTRSSSSSNRQQRTYLDFGCEGNIVGTRTHQYFCIVAPPDDVECNGEFSSGSDGNEFHIQLTKCCPRSGIVCARHYYNTTIEDDDDARDILSSSWNDNTNVLSFKMKRGESTTMEVTWNPIDDGSMRETIELEVRNSSSGAHWIQSLVLVGEAHCAVVNNDNDDEAVEQCVGTGDALVELQDGMMGEKHNINMVSDITDTISYSRGENTLDDSGTFNYGEDLLSLEDERHDHQLHHHLHLYDLEGKQVEDDSMVYSQETNELLLLLPKTDDGANENVLLWNANLSEIQEVGENDGNTRVEGQQLLLPQSGDIDRRCSTTTHKANEISVSLESSSVLLGNLAKIEETTDAFMDISTIRSVEPSFDILPEEKPCEKGQPKKPTNGASTLAKSNNDESKTPDHALGQMQGIGKLAKAEELVIISSAEALEQKQDLGIRMENWEKGLISTEEEEKQTTRIRVDREHQRLQSKQINDFEDLLVSEGLVEAEGNTLADDTDASDGNQIELVMDINSSLTNFIENMRSKSPSFGSFSSKNSIDDQSSSCLAGEAQDHLDELEDSTYSSQDDVDIEPTMSFAKMLEQTADSDNSYEEELGNAKSELNALIDEISEMEVDTQMQHEYITSPTNIDFYTQLVNLNDHADGTTPLHVNGISDRNKFFEGGIQPSSDIRPREQLSTVKLRLASQQSSFTKQPNSVTQERPESKECKLDKVPISTRSLRKSEHVAPINLARQKLSAISDASFKPPHNCRLEQISSLRDKLGLIKIDDTSNNCSTPHSADRNSQRKVSTAVTPRGTLMVNDLPNFTKTSARKCYFYSSPARHDTITNSSPTDINTQRNRSSVEAKECDENENELHPQGKTTVSLSHLRPRERMAHDKHIQSTRKQKYKDNNSPLLDNCIQGKARNGFSSPAVTTTTPSPRELKAYEKHIRSMRERLHRAGLTYSHPDAMHSTTGNDSPATRHVKRIGGVDSPMDRGRWSG